MFYCLTSLESWRILALSRVLRRTLTWRSLQRCLKLTYPGLLKSIGKQSHFFFFFYYSAHSECVGAKHHLFLLCSVKVCEMMFSLASKLATARTSGIAFILNTYRIAGVLFLFEGVNPNSISVTIYWFPLFCLHFSWWRKHCAEGQSRRGFNEMHNPAQRLSTQKRNTLP